MGQVISVTHEVVGNSVVFSADRSITGQSGWTFSPVDPINPDAGFAGELATRLFAVDHTIDNVWVASNNVVVRSTEGWDPVRVDHAGTVLSDFFVHYRD